MSLVAEAQKYENILDNYEKTIVFLLNILYDDKINKGYKYYLKVFNMLVGGNYQADDFEWRYKNED